MVLKPLVVAVVTLAMALGQILPGCGTESQSAVLIGWVDRKYVEPASDLNPGSRIYMLDINYRPYAVPKVFWDRVDVGDKVMWDGKQWVILQKASERSG